MVKDIIKPLAFGLVGLLAGYQIAVLTQSPPSAPAEKKHEVQPQKRLPAVDNYAVRKPYKNESLNAVQSHSNTNLLSDELSESIVRDDVNAMLARLEDLRSQGANSQIIATQFDLLKQFLIDNPENIGDLLGQLSSGFANKDSFYNLLSLIRSLPIEQTEPSLLSFAEQYAGASDQDSQEKLLAVLFTISKPIESDYITRSLVDMVAYGDTDIETRLEALSLVKSHQLQESEKRDINEKIKQLLNNANDHTEHEGPRLVSQLMRFSSKEQRLEIAGNLISQSNTEPIRNEVLNGINSGEIPASDGMKTKLIEIAAEPTDPLSQEALETLRYAFELSHEELSQFTRN